MLLISRKHRERITLRIKASRIPTTLATVKPEVPTAELDIVTLQQLAEIGRTIVNKPVKIVIAGLNPGRVQIGFEDLDQVFRAEYDR